jgi:16S rRNA (guanine966-N2)-methyltransferase
MAIRVISGTAKGRKLKMVPGDSTRPVRDIVKESLFNILGEWVRGSRWLDLFAGTGGIGIEALSRGAEYCLFLDTGRDAVRTIHENLEITGLAENAEVHRLDAFDYLSGEPGEANRYEVIYVAPPQYKDIWVKVLRQIDAQPTWLYPDGIVVVQIDPREYEDVPLQNLQKYDERKYGRTLLCFYEYPGA